MQKWLVGSGDVPLNVNFALSKPLDGKAFTKCDECYIYIVIIAMEYQITNYINWTNWGVWMHHMIAD